MSKGHYDEPEWFTAGPISLSDVIELRGFDEPQKDDSHQRSDVARQSTDGLYPKTVATSETDKSRQLTEYVTELDKNKSSEVSS